MVIYFFNRFFLKLLFLLFISFRLFAADTADVNEDESISISYGFENDFVTRYIWRGISYNDGFITQPSIWAEYNGFTFYTWASITVNDKNVNPKNNEVDFVVQYSHQFGDLAFEPSIAYYIYSNQEDSPPTAEANLKISFPVFEFELYSNVCLDISEYTGSLSGDFGLKKSLIENEELNLSANINTGWANKKFNETYIDISENTEIFHFISCSIQMDYYLSENIYIRPHLEYYYIFNSVLKSISGNNLTNFGLAVGVEF